MHGVKAAQTTFPAETAEKHRHDVDYESRSSSSSPTRDTSSNKAASATPTSDGPHHRPSCYGDGVARPSRMSAANAASGPTTFHMAKFVERQHEELLHIAPPRADHGAATRPGRTAPQRQRAATRGRSRA